MSSFESAKHWEGAAMRCARLAIVFVGILFGQFALYGPSLIGSKVLLPLDILASKNVLVPRPPEIGYHDPENVVLSDLVLLFEPERRFAASELRAGRIPMWAPYGYAGAPLLWPKLSPFLILQSLSASPAILAWTQVIAALVAGFGMFVFLRRIVRVGFWPSAIGAWCYPVTGFFVLWQGFHTAYAVYWLPWLLIAADGTVQGTSRWAPVGLSVAAFFVLVSGHLDVGAQVLLVSGAYAVWTLAGVGREGRSAALILGSVARLGLFWALGFFLAAPQILPSLEYARTGARMAERAAGKEERPPGGLHSLPQTVLPDVNGRMGQKTLYVGRGNQQESASAAYAGLVATLVLAPLAWFSRRHRSTSFFCVFLAFFGLSWSANLPGFVQLLRLPVLNMLSHNRLVFAAAFGFLVLAAIGLEAVSKAEVRWRPWLWAWPAILGLLLIWCLGRVARDPGEITRLEYLVHGGASLFWVKDMEGVALAREALARNCEAAAVVCGAGLVAWILVRYFKHLPRFALLLGLMLWLELLWSGSGRSVQTEPTLYYPFMPVLKQLALVGKDRIIGDNCFSPNLAAMAGLRDIKGYDGIDPARIVELMRLGADPESLSTPYALAQYLQPRVTTRPDGTARLSPVFDMLNVRYVIRRGAPPPGPRPAFQGEDYYVLENPNVLPRAYVPRRLEVVADKSERLAKLRANNFDPREVAYIERSINVADSCSGTVELVEHSPTHLSAKAKMETSGLLVLADNWDPGWRAYSDRKPTPILRVNHALRGVRVPAGVSTVVFRYEPTSFRLGLWMCALAMVVLIGWGAFTSGGRLERLPIIVSGRIHGG